MKPGPLFARTVRLGRHVKSFEIWRLSGGWIAAKADDRRVIDRRELTDWHRVERTASRFADEVSVLLRQGWVEA